MEYKLKTDTRTKTIKLRLNHKDWPVILLQQLEEIVSQFDAECEFDVREGKTFIVRCATMDGFRDLPDKLSKAVETF